MTAEGSTASRIANGHESEWSPDGLACYLCLEGSSGRFTEELWILGVGRHRVAIIILQPGCCSNGIVDDTLTWSPDLTRLAFEDGSEKSLSVANTADGTGNLGTVAELEVAAWTPSG